jgi:hypothetical protein
VARYGVAFASVDQFWHLELAEFFGFPAPGAKATPTGWVDSTGNIAPQQNPFADPLHDRVRYRNSGQQRLGVWMRWSFEHVVIRPDLDDPTQVYDSDNVRHVANDR